MRDDCRDCSLLGRWPQVGKPRGIGGAIPSRQKGRSRPSSTGYGEGGREPPARLRAFSTRHGERPDGEMVRPSLASPARLALRARDPPLADVTRPGAIALRALNRGVNSNPIGIYVCSVFVLSWCRRSRRHGREQGCGARQWHRDGAPGGGGPYVTGPARPKAATPGNRGPAVARGGPRIWVRQPAAIRRWRLPALHSPFGETEKRETAGRPGRPNSKPGFAKLWPDAKQRK